MAHKVRNILLVSSLYDACMLEEDCRLAERIINEYRGLNLSKPPRLTWVSSAEEALSNLDEKDFDLVITMPRLADMDAFVLGQEIKARAPDLPVFLLAHRARAPDLDHKLVSIGGIDRIFVWLGNADLLLAQIKSVEDRWNVKHDTEVAGVRVILFIEDSPSYISTILPVLYREVVSQTQAVMEEKLNEEHRLLTMRARAKILVAKTYEGALGLYEQFKPYILGIISDVRFPRAGKLDPDAGVAIVSRVKEEIPDIPVLLTSSESANRDKADRISADFLDKNSPSLTAEIHEFFLNKLGFGDFVFRMPDGQEVTRVSNVRALEKALATVPVESFRYHGSRNDFSRWLFARTETLVAAKMRPLTVDDFEGDDEKARQFVIDILHARRKKRQKGVVVDFDAGDFDPDVDFLKIGKGSLGGKARGLAFVSTLLHLNQPLHDKFSEIDIIVPHTLVITTEGFETFIEANNLHEFSKTDDPDEVIADHFLKAEFPDWIARDLTAYLAKVRYPLAIRSSGLLEDAQFRAYAGLYRTYMLPNDHPDLQSRVDQVIRAVKLVYASTFFQGPKMFSKRVGQRTEDEKMAVIVQELIGERYNGFFYPAISGVAQSRNYYPYSRIKPEDGCVTLALGLGKTVVEGGKALRFSPQHPQILPQYGSVEDILKNSQRMFYALKMNGAPVELGVNDEATLARRDISEADAEAPIQLLASTYIPEEGRIRDTTYLPGDRLLTFAPVLKFNTIPLSGLLTEILSLSHEGMGCPVEIEFSVNLGHGGRHKPAFALQQLRPMSARAELIEVNVAPDEIERAFAYSTNALGNTYRYDMVDILYVKPGDFDPGRTVEIAREIGRFNAGFNIEGRPYLLIGPGRWGSADRWLGIPVTWSDISGVAAIVETALPQLKAEPSQGSHFFHNVTTLGINYITITNSDQDFIDWDWLTSQPKADESQYVAHVMLDRPFVLKVDGRKSRGVMFV